MRRKSSLDYEALWSDLNAALAGKGGLQRAVSLLCEVPHYSWVGVYVVEGRDLVLGPWKGPAPTEHLRIPIGDGICGAAAASGRTEIVPDVNSDPRYISCFLSTKSEIVAPIFHDGRVVGEIDIDSDTPDAFTAEDARFLERVAEAMSESVGALAK